MRLRYLGLLLIMFIPMITVGAQSEPFTWEPYDFTITPPDGWDVQTTEAELILSASLDENSPLLSVRAVTPKSLPPDMEVDLLVQFAPYRRITVSEVDYGDNTWPTITDDMILGGRQMAMALIAETFIVSWSAETGQWEDLQPVFTDIIASIVATPVTYAPEELLTQRLSWRGISFAAPADWLLAYTGQDSHILVTSQEGRQFFGMTFTFGPLALEIIDLSAVRFHLSPSSLADIDLFVVQEDMLDSESITTEIDGDLVISSAPLVDAGQALLIISPNSAFVIAGIAGEEQWQASERALFEAILDTLTVD